jgi:hypothetical protein
VQSSGVPTGAKRLCSKRVDDRIRRNRIETRNKDWMRQMDQLVEAYLMYGMYDNGELRSEPPPPDEPSHVFGIEVVDVFCEFIHDLQQCL